MNNPKKNTYVLILLSVIVLCFVTLAVLGILAATGMILS